MPLFDDGRAAGPSSLDQHASASPLESWGFADAVPPSSNDGMLVVDRTGKVAPLTRQVDVVWRVPHGGRSVPLNQRFSQMWQLPRRLVNRMIAESSLRRAMRKKELEVYFQPQANLATGEIDGVEALVRWHHPSKGLVLPDDFIPLAEQSDIILALGEWVLRQACEQSAAWNEAGLPPLRMAVNLSPRQLEESRLADIVERALSESGVPSDRLELEITENVTMRDPVRAISILHDLKDLGLRVSMDDFGLGYSSLSHVKDLPLDTLKIDRSLIRGVTHSRSSAAIAMAIVAMASGMNLEVVAEGVETKGQLTFVKDIRCDRYQGFLLGYPEPASRLESVLKDPSQEQAA